MRTAPPKRRHGKRSVLIVGTLALGGIAAGCGGGSSSTGAAPGKAAGFIPSSALMYAEISTDLDGAQWKQLQVLGTKFPAYPDLIKQMTSDPKAALALNILRTNVGKHAAIGLSAPPTNIDRSSLPSARSLANSNAKWVIAVEMKEGKGEGVKKLLLADGTTKVSGTRDGAEILKMDKGIVGAMVDDTLVVSDGEADLYAALDAHKAGGDKTIAGTARVTDQLAKLPADVAMQAYVDIGGLVKMAANGNAQSKAIFDSLNASPNASVVMSVSAETNGIRMKGISTGVPTSPGGGNFEPKLASNVPSNAIAYVGLSNLSAQVQDVVGKTLAGTSPDAQRQLDAILPKLPDLLGVSIDDVKALATKEHALVVTPASGSAPLPGIALVLEQADGSRATKSLDAMRAKVPGLIGFAGPAASGVGQFKAVDLGGIKGWELPIKTGDKNLGLAPTYAVDGNIAYLGSTPEAIKSVNKPVSTLANNAEYAVAAKQVPGSVAAIAWLDVSQAVSAIRAVAKSQGEDDPFASADGKKALANLAPVKSAIGWSTAGDDSTSEAFVTIK